MCNEKVRSHFTVAAMLLLVASITLVTACASKLEIIQGYIKNAIRLDIKAASDLNYYSGQAHTLHLMVYELDNPNGFRSMLGSKSDRVALLEGGWRDASVKNVQDITIQPGEAKQIMLDRVADGRYLAVVAGYYEMNSKWKQVKLYSIDLFKEKHLWRTKKQRQILAVLKLGKQGFVN